MERDPLAKPDRPEGRVVVGREFLRQRQLQLPVALELDQRVVKLRGPGQVWNRHLGQRVERVRAGAAGQPDSKGTALHWGH